MEKRKDFSYLQYDGIDFLENYWDKEKQKRSEIDRIQEQNKFKFVN